MLEAEHIFGNYYKNISQNIKGRTMTTIAYADCPSGVSGDMFLAACLDLGLPLEVLNRELEKLALPGYRIEAWKGTKMGLTAQFLKVEVEEQRHHRRHSDIQEMIGRSGLSDRIKARARAVFERLAEVEGRMHGVDPAEVGFHEVGAVDSIVDVVGACIGLDYLGISRLYSSPLPLGTGWTKSAHGRLPLPAPATLVLLEGVPTYGTGLKYELVTPTGAAILATQAESFGPLPAMTISGVGHGAGTRDLPDRPNFMRLIMGRAEAGASMETLTLGETNLDDMNPEFLPYIMERMLTAGALDVWLTSIQMKKGRPGTTLSFLCRPGDLGQLRSIILTESTTLGIRTFSVERLAVPRKAHTIQTQWGEVTVKAVDRGGRTELVPEYEACRKIAEKEGLPLREVYTRVQALAAEQTEN
ncbi:MAG: nickel pincer cofactor biosynthesis protein LarC [Deltaproteobacteria bacterium]|nr:nickel pincer cofactor biosynthesis protein LarC [Deltaproteobacteria bacterium]